MVNVAIKWERSEKFTEISHQNVPSHPQFLSSINAVGCLALFRTLAIHNRIPHPLKIELQNGNFILKKISWGETGSFSFWNVTLQVLTNNVRGLISRKIMLRPPSSTRIWLRLETDFFFSLPIKKHKRYSSIISPT